MPLPGLIGTGLAIGADFAGFAIIRALVAKLLGSAAVRGAAGAAAARIAPTAAGQGIKRLAVRAAGQAAGEAAEQGAKKGALATIRGAVPTTASRFGQQAAGAAGIGLGTFGSILAGGAVLTALDGRSDVDHLPQFSAANAGGVDALNTQAVMDTVRSEEEVRALLREFVGSDDAVEDLLAAFSNPGTPMPRII